MSNPTMTTEITITIVDNTPTGDCAVCDTGRSAVAWVSPLLEGGYVDACSRECALVALDEALSDQI